MICIDVFGLFCRYYLYVYNHTMSAHTQQIVHQWPHCAPLLLNFIVSDITKLPPVKVTPRRKTTLDSDNNSIVNKSQKDAAAISQSNAEMFEKRSACLNAFVSEYGYMPLKHSNVRLDPHLYGDHVSITRKKYRQIDHIT